MNRIRKTLVLVIAVLMCCSSAFAQSSEAKPLPEGGFFGIATGLVWPPVAADAGYNFRDFGIRVSADLEYLALEGYARFRMGENGDSWYAGGGVGYSFLFQIFNYLYGSRPEAFFGVNALIGLQSESGWFIEYQPFVLLGFFDNSTLKYGGWIASAIHVKFGYRFRF